MLDVFSFICDTFANLILFLDDFKIVGTLSVLSILIILCFFKIAFKFLFPKKES